MSISQRKLGKARMLSVEQQYAQYPYPPYDPRSEHERFYTPNLSRLDQVSDQCFGGKLDIHKGIRVLDAGGGTGNATLALAEQLRDTPSEVVYLDISKTSLELAQEGARQRDLHNIHWVRGSIPDMSADGIGTFDYINCSGVLHHLPDPLIGLQALKRVLNPEGAIGIFVYGTYGRAERYRLQGILRALTTGAESPQEEVAIARQFLDAQDDTWKQANKGILHEAATDAGLYDLLLHSQDTPFTVPDVYDWLSKAGLYKGSFVTPNVGNGLGYRPERYLQDPVLCERALALAVPEQEGLAELLAGDMKKHFFFATQTPDTQANLYDPDMIPAFSMSFGDTAYAALRKRIQQHTTLRIFKLPNGLTADVPLPQGSDSMFAHMLRNRDTNSVTTTEIVRGIAHNIDMPAEQVAQDFEMLFNPLRAVDWLVLRHKSMPPFKNSGTIQANHLQRRGDQRRTVRILDGLAETIHTAIAVPTEHYTYAW